MRFAMVTLALIGRGKWGSKYLDAVKSVPDCRIKYTATRNYQYLKGLDDIDGIIIATPSSTHSEIINYFPEHYLLVEKPLTTSYADALAIKNKKVMIGQIYLYNPALQNQLRDIGKITSIYFRLVTPDTSDGNLSSLWELAPHGVSLCISQLGIPKTVKLHQRDGLWCIQLYYNEATCIVEFGWSSGKEKRIVVVGDKRVVFDDSEKQEITPLENQIRAFADFIGGSPCRSPLAHGAQVVSILEKAEQSYLDSATIK